MNDPLSAPATQVQNNFGAYLAKVNATGTPVLVERHGKPVAVLVGYKTWREKTSGLKKSAAPWTDACRKFTAGLQKKHPGKRHASSVELIRQLREEH